MDGISISPNGVPASGVGSVYRTASTTTCVVVEVPSGIVTVVGGVTGIVSATTVSMVAYRCWSAGSAAF